MDADLVRQFAPRGVLRASVCAGHAVLASCGTPGAEPRGVSADLARALAGRLGLAMQPVIFATVGKSVAGVACGQADVGFFALDAARATQVRCTPPYVVLEGACLAMGIPAGRSDAVLETARQFIEDMKGDGFVARALKRHGIEGVRVAPAAGD